MSDQNKSKKVSAASEEAREIGSYTLAQLKYEARHLRASVKRAAIAQGFFPVFAPNFEIRLNNVNSCLSVRYTINGVRQVSNCAL